MKILIQADFEGVTGITNFGQIIPGTTAYPEARRYLAADINAAVEGIFVESALRGLTPTVVVADGHFHMQNLNLDDLDPRVQGYVVGYERQFIQLEGLDETYDGVFCVGQHDQMGGDGLLAHTFVRWRWIVNELECSETLINAYTAGEFGVPLALVTGDDVIVGKVTQFYDTAGLWVEGAVTKKALAYSTALCYAPQVTRATITAAARRATAAILEKRCRPLRCARPVTFRLVLNDADQADRACAAIPALNRVADVQVDWTAASFREGVLVAARVLRLFFEEILARACRNVPVWYRQVLPS